MLLATQIATVAKIQKCFRISGCHYVPHRLCITNIVLGYMSMAKEYLVKPIQGMIGTQIWVMNVNWICHISYFFCQWVTMWPFRLKLILYCLTKYQHFNFPPDKHFFNFEFHVTGAVNRLNIQLKIWSSYCITFLFCQQDFSLFQSTVQYNYQYNNFHTAYTKVETRIVGDYFRYAVSK